MIKDNQVGWVIARRTFEVPGSNGKSWIPKGEILKYFGDTPKFSRIMKVKGRKIHYIKHTLIDKIIKVDRVIYEKIKKKGGK